MKNRYVPLKNYFLASVTIIAIILLTLYFFKWYKVYQEEQTRESYLLKTSTISMQISNMEDINTILSEAPSNYFIYVSYVNSKDILNLEKKMKKVIDDYGLNDIVYYIDVTKYKENKTYLEDLNNYLGLNNYEIKNVPTIIYVKNGKIDKSNIIQSDNKIFKISSFEKIIKDNDIEKRS